MFIKTKIIIQHKVCNYDTVFKNYIDSCTDRDADDSHQLRESREWRRRCLIHLICKRVEGIGTSRLFLQISENEGSKKYIKSNFDNWTILLCSICFVVGVVQSRK